MKVYEQSGKDYEKVLEEILKENELKEEDIVYKSFTKKGGIFKGTTNVVTVVKLEDICEYVKDFLSDLLRRMGLDVTFESRIRDKQIYIKMFSDNNSILIGKNGQTLSALQLIVRQIIIKETKILPYIILDVENYKDKKNENLERLARRTAKEVRATGIDASLENMNSYERRIVHNALTDFKGVTTISEGEEPNRHVIIKKAE